jgi:ATP-dependent 26S proteasome regulatory subunit
MYTCLNFLDYYYGQLYINVYVNFIEAGLFAIRAEREYVMDEDFMKAVRKVAENKKLETKLDYKPV